MLSEKDVVYITRKQASIATVFLVLLGLCAFVLGYFWGKRSGIEEFGQKVTQESINDKVNYAQMMQSFADKTKSVELDEPETKEESFLNLEQVDTQEAEEKKEINEQPVFVEQKKVEVAKKPVHKKHSAILIGFGSKAAAQQFVQRLKKHTIDVEIKTRVSKSASGKTKRTWYQVVTKSYDSKETLQEVINKIKKFERLKDSDIKIV